VRFHPYARVLTPDSSGRRDVQDRLTGLQDKVSAHTLGVSDDKVTSTIRRAWAKNTLKKYSGSIERYKRFCASRNFDPTVCFPASEATLCAFAADAAGSRAASTIKNDLAGVRAWHIVNDAPFPSGIQLAYVLKGAENMTPTGSRKPLRPPMTLSKLLALLEGFDHNAPLDAAVFFAASAAFYGQLRLGEIFATREREMDMTRIPSLQNVRPPNVNGSRRIHLPYTKVAKDKGEEVILCRQHHPTDPIAAFENHLRVNNLSPANALASFRSKDGSIRLLTKSRFLKRCNEIWVRAGLARSTGHEFRIGGTTHFLLSKVPPDIVKLMGRWSSDAFQRYWRQIEVLAPLYVEFLKPLTDIHSSHKNRENGTPPLS
jgi:integrase